jgi:uncharacterized protein
MSADQAPQYDELDSVLRGMEAVGAAEAHGIIAGVLSGPTPRADAWNKTVLADIDPAADTTAAERLLGALRAETQTRLAERESDFSPLLPGEHASLIERVGALADFCRGFLFGLVAGGVRDLNKLPDDAREVVNDFMRIAEAEADSPTGDEADEHALAELTEYVRVGVQLVYEELHSGD